MSCPAEMEEIAEIIILINKKPPPTWEGVGGRLFILLSLRQHDHLNVIAALQQHIVQEVAYRVGSQSLNGLLIVCMEIQSMILEGSNDVHPVAVLLGVNINLLQHILLHLLQFVSINSLLHVGDTLVQQTNSNLLLVGIHRAVSLEQGNRLVT